LRGRWYGREEVIEVRRCVNGHDYVYRKFDSGVEENARCPVCLSEEYTLKYRKIRMDDGLYAIEEASG